jgi:CRP-like cAMP-binding protein
VSVSNALLASLSPDDAATLGPHLKTVYLEAKQILFETGGYVNAVYFPVGAVISLVVALSTGEMIEAAMVGKDGAIGVSSSLDGKIALSRAVVQLSGNAIVCDTAAFKRAVLRSEALLSLLIRHEQTVYAQAQQSTACMASHDVQSRLCRWLLRARDLSSSDNLPFTQEFLAEMLGVRRTSVTVVAHTLQQAGMIRYTRGKIQIINVDGLRESACECYEAVRSQYGQLLGKNNLEIPAQVSRTVSVR